MKAVGYFEREVVFVLLEQENVGATSVQVKIFKNHLVCYIHRKFTVHRVKTKSMAVC